MNARRWKLGQLSPGSTVTFSKISWQDAQACTRGLITWTEAVQASINGQPQLDLTDGTFGGTELYGILYRNEQLSGSPKPAVTFRQVGSLHCDDRLMHEADFVRLATRPFS
jgi:hypothetical protein